MRVNNTFSGRPQFYDRGPLAINKLSSQGAIAPHGLTNRWTYTVPSNRKFSMGIGQAKAVRVTVATTAAEVSGVVNWTPLSGTTTSILDTEVFGNAIGNQDSAYGGTGSFGYAGDVFTGQDVDLSTAGTAMFVESLMGTEFDA